MNPFRGAPETGGLPNGHCVRYLISVSKPSEPAAPVPAPVEPSVPLNAGEPPVVARLVIEIRSDGTRTIARGVLEDQQLGERVAIHAEGTTPANLAASLVQSILKAPFFGLTKAPEMVRNAVRALLPGRRR